MPRLNALGMDDADGRAGELLVAVERKLGMVPNVLRTMANSPAVLEAYLAMSDALANGALSGRTREQIALAVAEANACEYCLAAHTALGRRAALTPDEIAASRRGVSGDPKTNAALGFARKLVGERGRVSDDDVDQLRAAGFDDGAIAEIVANVAANLFTNYVNHVAGTDIDFPEAAPLEPAPACAC